VEQDEKRQQKAGDGKNYLQYNLKNLHELPFKGINKPVQY
jgi:hypothetical protein